MAYVLQENGLDTVEANLELGFVDDARNYDDAIRVLKKLRSNPVTLITNNPRKLAALQKSGANVAGYKGPLKERNLIPAKGALERYRLHLPFPLLLVFFAGYDTKSPC